MQKIEHDGKIISIIYRDEDWVEGLHFITPNELFCQAGSWWYQKGEILQNHIHNFVSLCYFCIPCGTHILTKSHYDNPHHTRASPRHR